MITCPNCGHANDSNAFRCTNCDSVIQQPPATPYGPPQGQPPSWRAPVQVPNYLAQSIIVTIMCCMPAGIPAIVFAAQSMSQAGSGDYTRALDNASKAKMWCWVAFGLGASIWVAYVLFFIFAVAGEIAFES